MKNKIYKDDFEGFLKDNANDFLMVPSRKVWYSIYNDMHPDRKWPSMAVCLLILSAVLYIGVSNNNSLSDAARRSLAKNSAAAMQNAPERSGSAQKRLASVNSRGDTETGVVNDLENFSADENLLADDLSASSVQSEEILAGISGVPAFIVGKASEILLTDNARSNMHLTAGETENNVFNADLTGNDQLTPRTTTRNLLISERESNISPETSSSLSKKSLQSASPEATASSPSDPDKSWREDFAFRNKPSVNKFRQKASMGYYITPSFGYRGFFVNREQRGAAMSANGEEKLNDGAALNLELGAALQYKISPDVRIKAGMQANYTNYISKVTALQHPQQTTLATSDRSAVGASEYAVKSGEARLNKTTFQISMPVGADLKLAGKNKIKWYLGAAVQPTYVISGSAYVLSADGKNYVSETPLLRKWNMNAALETFLSFRSASGVTLNVGPQVRYQLMSTYNKEYNYTEKLYNIGVKIGISTDF